MAVRAGGESRRVTPLSYKLTKMQVSFSAVADQSIGDISDMEKVVTDVQLQGEFVEP